MQQSYGIFTFSLISAKFGALKALPSDSDTAPLRSVQCQLFGILNSDFDLTYVVLLLLLDPFCIAV